MKHDDQSGTPEEKRFRPSTAEMESVVQVLDRTDEVMEIQSLAPPDSPPAAPPGSVALPGDLPGLVDTQQPRQVAPEPSAMERGAGTAGRTLQLVAAICVLGAVLIFFWGAMQAARQRYTSRGLAEGQVSEAGEGEEAGDLARLEKDMAFIIYSRPDKADVVIGAVPRGRTPAAANVQCLEGDMIQVVVSLPRRTPYTNSFRCKTGSVRLNVELSK